MSDNQVQEREPETSRMVQIYQENHVGPFPHPETLAGYEKVYPGMIKIVLDHTLHEQAHRHATENKALDIEELQLKLADRSDFRGQIFGFVASLICLGIAAYSVYCGNNWGISSLVIPIAGLVFAFRKK